MMSENSTFIWGSNSSVGDNVSAASNNINGSSSAEDVAGVFATSILLGLMTLTTIVGKLSEIYE
jgi:hypothetical protein